MTLHQMQTDIDDWIKTYGVRYFNELTNMTVLTEEVGELARLMAREYGEQSYKKPKEKMNIKKKIADELADIIFVTSCLANQMNIDLTKALERNLEKKTKRDNDRHKRNEKL